MSPFNISMINFLPLPKHWRASPLIPPIKPQISFVLIHLVIHILTLLTFSTNPILRTHDLDPVLLTPIPTLNKLPQFPLTLPIQRRPLPPPNKNLRHDPPTFHPPPLPLINPLPPRNRNFHLNNNI